MPVSPPHMASRKSQVAIVQDGALVFGGVQVVVAAAALRAAHGAPIAAAGGPKRATAAPPARRAPAPHAAARGAPRPLHGHRGAIRDRHRDERAQRARTCKKPNAGAILRTTSTLVFCTEQPRIWVHFFQSGMKCIRGCSQFCSKLQAKSGKGKQSAASVPVEITWRQDEHLAGADGRCANGQRRAGADTSSAL